MDPPSANDRFERLNQILNDALELPPEQREPFIRHECGPDEGMCHSLLGLLNVLGPYDRTRTIANAPSLKPGDLLDGGYRIVRLLGRGGMGEVYEAEDPEMDEHVAVKTIRADIASDEASIARFRKEIQLGRKVSHPNVCNIYSIGKHDVLYFFTMELLSGETLSARLRKRGRMTCAEALPLLSQMADALAAAHDAGIIHRDFKPGNVMLLDGDTRRKAVVTVFGLARLVKRPEPESRTGSTHFAGTPAYMAPEQLEDAPLSPATDIYALGLVAYEMVTARRPFEGSSDISAAIQRLSGNPVPPVDWVPELDRRWNTAILRCLERDPANRWPSACDFIQALDAPIPTTPVLHSLPPRAHKIALKHWWRLASLAVLVVAAALAVWILQRPPATPAPAQEWLDKGTAAVRDGVYWKATTELSTAIDIDRDLPLAYARRAEAWNEMDSPDRAADDMAKAHAHLSRLGGLDRLYVDAINSTVAREFPDAVEKYKNILNRLPRDQKHFGHVDLGRAYEKNAESAKALAEYKEATEEWPNWPGSWLRRGVLERNLSMLDQARLHLTKALELFRVEGDSEGRAQATFELARMSHGPEAEKLLAGALPLAGENLFQQIAIKLQQSSVAAAAGNFAQAKELASEAESLADAKGMPVLAARSLIDFGAVLVMFGRSAEAENYFHRAFDIGLRLHAERQQYGALLNLGGLLLTANPNQARQDLEQSRAWFSAHGYRREAAAGDTLLARVDRNAGDYGRALNRLRTAATEAADPATQSATFRDLGAVYLTVESYPEAYAAATQARQLDAASGNKRLLAADDELLGISLSQSGDFGRALDALAQAESEGFPAPEIALDRAETFLAFGQYDKALHLSELLLRSTVDPDDLLDTRRIRCLALARLGKPQQGQPLCKQAVEAGMSSDQGRIDNAKLALAYVNLKNGDFRSTLQTTGDLLLKFEKHNQASSLWRCLVYRAEAARLNNDPDTSQDAAAHGEAAFERFSKKQTDAWMMLYLSRSDIAADAAELKSFGAHN